MNTNSNKYKNKTKVSTHKQHISNNQQPVHATSNKTTKHKQQKTKQQATTRKRKQVTHKRQKHSKYQQHVSRNHSKQ